MVLDWKTKCHILGNNVAKDQKDGFLVKFFPVQNHLSSRKKITFRYKAIFSRKKAVFHYETMFLLEKLVPRSISIFFPRRKKLDLWPKTNFLLGKTTKPF